MCGVQINVCIYFVDAERIFVYIFRWYLGGAIHEYTPTFFYRVHASMDITAYGHITLLRMRTAVYPTI